MGHASLTTYSRKDSYLRRVKKLSKSEADKVVGEAMLEAQDIFEEHVCDFYVEQGQGYLVPDSLTDSRSGAAPFSQDSIRSLCEGIFSAVKELVSRPRIGRKAVSRDIALSAFYQIDKQDMGGFNPEAWFRSTSNYHERALNTIRCHAQATKIARQKLKQMDIYYPQLKVYPAFVWLCASDSYRQSTPESLVDPRYDLRARMDPHFHDLVTCYSGAATDGVSPGSEQVIPNYTASLYSSGAPSDTAFIACSGADSAPSCQSTEYVDQRLVRFPDSSQNQTAFAVHSGQPQVELGKGFSYNTSSQ
jgi:hypothetical protein